MCRSGCCCGCSRILATFTLDKRSDSVASLIVEVTVAEVTAVAADTSDATDGINAGSDVTWRADEQAACSVSAAGGVVAAGE